MFKRVEATVVIALFAALAVTYTYPLVFGLRAHLPSDLGDPVLTTWTLAWDADRFRHGLSGIWDAPNFFPYRRTLLYSDHLLGVAVFTAPVQWLTHNPVLAYNIAFLASFVLNGVGMYVLARELTGRFDASLVAGFVYVCHPFRMSHLSHLQWLITGWLPLMLWAVHRYARTRELHHMLAAALFFLLQSLTAAYFTYFALLPLAIVAAVELWRARPWTASTPLHVALATAFVVAVTLPVARAYYDVRDRTGFRRDANDIAQMSATVGDYLRAAPRLRLWGKLGTSGGEHELFPGALALTFAIVGVVASHRQSNVRTYAAIALAAFALSLGPSGPYRWLLRMVPGLDGVRAPARFAVVVQLGLAVLAGYGSAWWLSRRPRMRAGILMALVAGIAAEGFAAPIATPTFDPSGPLHERELYAALRRLPAGAVVELPVSATDAESEFAHQYMTLVHGHPVVNGHSGYVSPLVAYLGGGHSPVRDSSHAGDLFAMFRALDVRYVVLRRSSFDDPSIGETLTAASEDDHRDVLAVRHFGDALLAILLGPNKEPQPGETRAISSAAIRTRASQSNDRLPFLFDGDPDSRWTSGAAQGGSEWIELQLDDVRDVRVVRLQMAARSFADYPRELAVDVIEQDGERTLFRGPVLPQFARGLIADATFPWIEISLAANHARTIRLRQIGAVRTFFWSIHELQLREAQP